MGGGGGHMEGCAVRMHSIPSHDPGLQVGILSAECRRLRNPPWPAGRSSAPRRDAAVAGTAQTPVGSCQSTTCHLFGSCASLMCLTCQCDHATAPAAFGNLLRGALVEAMLWEE